MFDASVVRGLSYYTGVVFEGFDRAGELRAICGGGRYDKLLSALGGEDRPMVGFGFGDAVIMELVNDKGLLPESLKRGSVDDVVYPMSATLRPAAMEIAARLRAAGRAVDLVRRFFFFLFFLRRFTLDTSWIYVAHTLIRTCTF